MSKQKIILLFLIGAAVRLMLIFFRSHPSSEEVWALLLAQAPIKDIWLATFADLHGPFYFLLLRLLELATPFQLNIVLLRLLSLFWGIVASVAIWYLATLVLGRKTGLLSFYLSLFLPAFIAPAVFARYYTFLILLVTISLLCFIHFLKYGHYRALCLITFVSIVGIYTHYYFVLLNISFTVFLLISKRYKKYFMRLLLVLIIVWLFFIPGLWYLLTLPKPELLGRHENSWLKLPALVTTNITSSETLIFLYYRGNFLIYFPVLVVLSISTLALVVKGFRGWKNPLRNLFVSVILVPPLTTTLFAYTVKPLLSLGSLQIFIPSFVIILANGILADTKKIVTTLFLVTAGMSLLFMFQTSDQYYAQPRKDFVYFINAFKADDIALHSHLGSFLLASHYVGRGKNYEIIRSLSVTPQTARGVGFKPISFAEVESHRGGIWYFESPFISTRESDLVKSRLSQNFTLVHEEQFRESKKRTGETYFNVYYYK